MKKFILALDCSLRWTNAAVSLDGDVLASEQRDLGRRQAAELPDVVRDTLAKAGASFDQVGLIAVTNGPGYFTGIRVGAAYAAALAYGLGIDIVPVSTLRMLAGGIHSPLLAVVYAGRQRVYAASFGCENNLPEGEYGKDEINRWLRGNEGVKIVSDAPEKTFLPCLAVRPDAAEAARIARRCPELAVSPMEFRATYYRSPV